jgi:Protein of unknown function (DUF3987)
VNSPTLAFDANNIASIQAAMAIVEPTVADTDVTTDATTIAGAAAIEEPVIADATSDATAADAVVDQEPVQPEDDDEEILDEILEKIITLLNENKTTIEIKTSLGESYEEIADVVDELILRGKREVIQKLKNKIKMALADLDEDFADVDLLEVDEGADLDEQIRILRENEWILDEAILDEAAANKLPPNQGPKFGKQDGPVLGFHIEGAGAEGPDILSGRVWLDVDGVNIYDGTRVKLEPWMQEQFRQAHKREARNWLRGEEYAKKKAQVYEGDDEYPVRILPPQPGPLWNDKILYGIAGEIVRKVSAHCESHPAGMLLDFLVSFGSIVGRGPYFNIGATKHFTNEFMCRVGDSSKSRKGTGRDAIDDVLKHIDPKWYADRVTSGFGSAEAIISQIKDTTTEMRQVKGVYSPVVVRGVDDKRLCIREGEIASVFVLTGKTESRADIVFRDGWDGKALRNIVKGKTTEGLSNSAKCEEPHLSISGDTTIHELRRKMPQGSDENGFGNRFIYVYVYRVKDCPLGGPQLDWSKEIEQLCLTLQWAKKVKHISMTGAARQWWVDKYHSLEHDGPDGLAGKMTARAPAHVRRLAMLYALLDHSDQIDTKHFQAAMKLWNYCSESAVFIFGGATSEQLRIQNWIGLRQTATYKQVRDELYQRNKPVGEIKADLAALVAKKMLHLTGDIYSKKGV